MTTINKKTSQHYFFSAMLFCSLLRRFVWCEFNQVQVKKRLKAMKRSYMQHHFYDFIIFLRFFFIITPQSLTKNHNQPSQNILTIPNSNAFHFEFAHFWLRSEAHPKSSSSCAPSFRRRRQRRRAGLSPTTSSGSSSWGTEGQIVPSPWGALLCALGGRLDWEWALLQSVAGPSCAVSWGVPSRRMALNFTCLHHSPIDHFSGTGAWTCVNRHASENKRVGVQEILIRTDCTTIVVKNCVHNTFPKVYTCV